MSEENRNNFQEQVEDVKEKAGEIFEESKVVLSDLGDKAKDVSQTVIAESKEVYQEAKAAFSGETLQSANTVGGAGYRAANKEGETLAVISLVCGILSIIIGFAVNSFAGLLLGIVGIVLGSLARKQNQSSLATAGFVISIISVILLLLVSVCALLIWGSLVASFTYMA